MSGFLGTLATAALLGMSALGLATAAANVGGATPPAGKTTVPAVQAHHGCNVAEHCFGRLGQRRDSNESSAAGSTGSPSAA